MILQYALNNFKNNFKYDFIVAAFFMFWLVTLFLFISLDKIPFWRSLFYLFIYHFMFLVTIVFAIRLFAYKMANLFINGIYVIFFFILLEKQDFWFEIFSETTFGIKNHNWGKLGLLLILAISTLLTYKKITQKGLIFVFAIMSFSNLLVHMPNIYDNINTQDEFIEPHKNLSSKSLYKNPDRPNIYILMVDTYPSFYNAENYLNFKNEKLKRYLTENDFTLYEKMYANMPATLSSMSVFFGHENIQSDNYDYYENPEKKGHYLKQKYITQLKEMGYTLHHNIYVKKLDLDHHFLLGFYSFMGLPLSDKTFEHFKYMDKQQQQLIDYNKSLGHNIVMNSLKTADRNSITLVFSNELAYKYKCFENGKYLKGTELTIDRIKCANENVKKSIDAINQFDKNAIIVLMADHGNFVRDNTLRQKETNKIFDNLSLIRDFIRHSGDSEKRINWIDNDNKIEKKFGVLLSIRYPQKCSDYAQINFYSLQSVMPLVMSCIHKKTALQTKLMLPKHEYSIFDGDHTVDDKGVEKGKKYIINGIIQP